jgi:ketosteroid isomerase-like protein
MSDQLEPDPALTAMRQWQTGAATGDWSGLLALLEPEVAFRVPVAGFPGRQRGLPAATRFFEHLTAVLRADLVITSTLRGGDRTGFEVAVHGTMHGHAFVQALCLVFDVVDGRVRAFDEYLAWPGGLAPDAEQGGPA